MFAAADESENLDELEYYWNINRELTGVPMRCVRFFLNAVYLRRHLVLITILNSAPNYLSYLNAPLLQISIY